LKKKKNKKQKAMRNFQEISETIPTKKKHTKKKKTNKAMKMRKSIGSKK